MIDKYTMSERRACRLLNLARSTKRYQSRRSERDQELKQQLRAWAEKRPRFGYRRLWAELVRAGVPVNHKRVHRLYRQEGMALRCRRRRKFLRRVGVAAPAPLRPNQRCRWIS